LLPPRVGGVGGGGCKSGAKRTPLAPLAHPVLVDVGDGF
jgi:hypothetical protein